MIKSTVSYTGRTETENILSPILWSYDRWKPKSTYNEINISQQNNDKKNICLISSFEKNIFKKALNKRINEQSVSTNMRMITRMIRYMIKITQF